MLEVEFGPENCAIAAVKRCFAQAMTRARHTADRRCPATDSTAATRKRRGLWCDRGWLAVHQVQALRIGSGSFASHRREFRPALCCAATIWRAGGKLCGLISGSAPFCRETSLPNVAAVGCWRNSFRPRLKPPASIAITIRLLAPRSAPAAPKSHSQAVFETDQRNQRCTFDRSERPCTQLHGIDILSAESCINYGPPVQFSKPHKF